ncbi:glycoside hydrolase family 88/105 protein [Aliiruegeria sabulilitoris]|uniref:glycoside hydrolase family 88/105 protein n=1 Tax=Aliiruegeria sabulilitoris TaxID=1510458 RepID=UPI00082C980F|nr:glycoside hydrolase family 88 protein [Aliiruegeria sabulilitoris]NDR55722.1 di-trans,poly-cis-decaprenylcistransferase [Pseudoruegeria sp. M32A2M]
MLMTYFETYLGRYEPYKNGAWCYEDGCIYRGLECLHRATGEPRWRVHLVRMVDARMEDGPALAGYDPNAYNIDNVLPGRALLYLHEITDEQRYLDAAALLAGQLVSQPRTRSGVYWHKLRYPWQVWLDGIYMGAPFQIGYGLRVGDDALLADALTQVGTALDMTYVPASGLYAHAVDEARKQPWANPETGHSRAHWARALGWLAMALVDIAELVGPERFAPLQARTRALLDRIAELRQPGGLWLQVIDRPDLAGNYEESSASAMFIYALLRGDALGLSNGVPEGLFELLTEKTLRPAQAGGLEFVEICEVAGLGMFEDRFRDGSAEYYLSERRVADDAKGVGPLMMAAASALEREESRTPLRASR